MTSPQNGRHGVPDTHVWDPATRQYLIEGADPGGLLKRHGGVIAPETARDQARAVWRALKEIEARPPIPVPTSPTTPTKVAPALTYPADLHILPTQPPGSCIQCGSTESVRRYLTGDRCPQHPPRKRADYYGLAVPMSDTHYDPNRLARHKTAPPATAVGLLPPEDSARQGWCERCPVGWPVNSTAEIAATSAIHYQVKHADGGWMIGPRGGAVERTCGPCGGESPGGFRIIDGKDTELPPRGETFGPTFASARHDLCQNGDRRGRQIIRCDCQHRTGNRHPTPPEQVTA